MRSDKCSPCARRGPAAASAELLSGARASVKRLCAQAGTLPLSEAAHLHLARCALAGLTARSSNDEVHLAAHPVLIKPHEVYCNDLRTHMIQVIYAKYRLLLTAYCMVMCAGQVGLQPYSPSVLPARDGCKCALDSAALGVLSRIAAPPRQSGMHHSFQDICCKPYGWLNNVGGQGSSSCFSAHHGGIGCAR